MLEFGKGTMLYERPRRSSLVLAVPSNRLRRAVPWIIFVAFLVFTQLYFSSIRNSEFVRNTLEILGTYKSDQQPTPSQPRVLHVLLVAYARTGSSFIGDLMQSLPDSFYYFEPLHFIQGPVLNDSLHEARNLLGDLFVCNVSQIEGFLPWQMKHKSYMKLQRNIRYWKECSKNNTCYDGSYIDGFCRNQTTVIAKTIRINLLEASRLFTSHPHLNLKIIYLTRDPRGTMNSRMKKPVNAWCKQDPMCSDSRHFCSVGLASDVKTACDLSLRRPDDFMVIRYEDISTDPYETTRQVVGFLGLDSVPRETQEFLKTHTHFVGNVRRKSKAAGLEFPYTTFRNSSITAMSWRREMPFKEVIALQKVCRPFLSAFGYYSYRTVSTLRSNSDMNANLQKTLENKCSASSEQEGENS